MASTQTDESEEQTDSATRRKRFVSAPSTAAVGSEGAQGSDSGTPQEQGPLMGRGAAIGGVAMGAAALLCFVLAAGFSGGEATVSDETATQVFGLQEQVRALETQTDALPDAKDADRALVTAQTAADEIAQRQNNYSHLTPEIAAAGGVLDPQLTLTTLRNLTPYFDPSVSQSSLEPWYLLDSDKNVPSGVGIPMSFKSGFTWVAQRPYTITEDSTIEVTWLAVQTVTAEGEKPAVLAWAKADYDITRKTFSKVRTGTTVIGEALRMEVKTQ